MTAQDPLIRLSVLSAALERGEQTMYLSTLKGEIPRHDTLLSLKQSHTRAWKLSTLRHWRPAVAARCLAILHALESIPIHQDAA